MTAPINEKLNRFIELTERKRDYEAKVREMKEELEPLEMEISKYFDDNEQQAATIKGWTVYRKRDISIKSASGVSSDIVDKLRRARLGELIGVNWPGIKAWVKERMYNEQTDTWEIDLNKLPPTLREIVTVDEFYRINCKRAS